MKEPFCYDCECYPNYFLAVFKQTHTGETRSFHIFHDHVFPAESFSHAESLIAFIQMEVLSLIGYNNSNYDNVLMHYLLDNVELVLKQSPAQLTQNLFKINHLIINDQKKVDGIKRERNKYIQALSLKTFFPSLDLMAMYNTVERVSLKQIAINLRWPNIQDLPYPPGHIVLRKEVPDIELYCINDVDITDELRRRRTPDLQFRKDLGKLYGLNLVNYNDTNIAKATIRKFYLEGTGKSWESIKNLKTHAKKLRLRECISKKINFCTPKYGALFIEMLKTEVNIRVNKKGNINVGDLAESFQIKAKAAQGDTEAILELMGLYEDRNKKEYEREISSKYVDHTVGLGGIHSKNKPQEFREDDDYEYMDLDVSGFYPWIIVNEKLYPRHLGPEFVSIYKEKIVDMRDSEKKAGNIVNYKSLKISSNASFGLMKNIYSWLFDPWPPTYICISGQLFLLMLMERLEEYTDNVIVYSNTDGLTVRVPKDGGGSREAFYKICKQWMQATGFRLEFSVYKKMIIRDVSNFFITYEDADGKGVKQKGLYTTIENIMKSDPPKALIRGYRFPIIAKALEYYYLHDFPGRANEYIKEYIEGCRDIFEFMKAERTQSKFTVGLQHKPDAFDNWEVEVLQKSNRWVITKGNPHEGKLFKTTGDPAKGYYHAKAKLMHKEHFVTVCNDTRKIDNIESMNLDYDFYIGEVMTLINIIKKSRSRGQDDSRQVNLFMA